jgi:hypothetical protein
MSEFKFDPKMVLFPVVFIGLRSVNLAEHVEILKPLFVVTMVVLLVLHLYLRYLITKADDKTPVTVKNDDGTEKKMTVVQYDLSELNQKLVLFPVLVVMAFGLYAWKEVVQPFAMMPIMQTYTFVTNPLAKIYLLGGVVPRPFGTKAVKAEVTRTESTNKDAAKSEAAKGETSSKKKAKKLD